MSNLLEGFAWSEQGAGDRAIDRIEAVFGDLPRDYVRVLGEHGGGEGWVGNGSYLVLWPAEELIENNAILRAKELIPDVALIGGDGADNLFGIEIKSGVYLRFPAIGLDLSEAAKMAGSWKQFLVALSRS